MSKMRINRQYWTEDFINRLAKVGSYVSRHCRDCWTGEQIATAVPIDKLAFGGRRDIAYLDGIGLLGLEDIADLFQARLAQPDQYSWTLVDWQNAIRKAIQ